MPPAPSEEEVLVPVSRAKKRLIQQKWQDAGGSGELLNVWQIRNPLLELKVRTTEHDFAKALGHNSDIVDGWHGTAESNVFSIAQKGFDPSLRAGQVFGEGEYFAKDPNVSVSYCRGGAFMFLCRLLLGAPETDHTWVFQHKYYVLKQREGRMQALPLFLVQFRASDGSLNDKLYSAALKESNAPNFLAERMRGGTRACEARRGAGMLTESTQYLFLGWLAPDLVGKEDEVIAADVKAFLEGFPVEEVIPDRNGARMGAFVKLSRAIDKAEFATIQGRTYRESFKISVDDEQPMNPLKRDQLCPKLCGPSRFCRGWNLRGHCGWKWACSFSHPPEQWPSHGARFELETLEKGAKHDEIFTEFVRSKPFVAADGRSVNPRILGIKRVKNPVLEKLFEERKAFLHDKHGFAMEKDLWHGTNCKVIPDLLKHGLQPPSDTKAADSCPISGGKGLSTTLCGTDCKHCTEPHVWSKCHMYGLGIYLADMAQKSHRYVREPRQPGPDARPGAQPVYSMLRCRVCLGNPFLIEGHLLKKDSMHDLPWCEDPSEFLESCPDEWSLERGHNAYYVRGLSSSAKAGLGVFNSEYIVFHPHQVLPLYLVDYVLE